MSVGNSRKGAKSPPLPPNRKVPGRRRSSVGDYQGSSAPETHDPDFEPSATTPSAVRRRATVSVGFTPVSATSPSSPSSPPRGPSVALRDGLRASLGVLLTVALAVACVAGLVRYTRTSPRFAIRTIDITGASHRTPAEVARTGGIEVGRNIFAADLETTRSHVLEDPWIEKASVARRLPGTVRIEVVEREAAALVAAGADIYLSTRRGELFKRFETGDPFDLPVVTGVDPEDFARDRDGATDTVRRALDLAAEYERVGPAKAMPVQEVHVGDDGGLVLAVGKPPVALHLGRGPFRQPLEQAARALAEVAHRHAQVEVVYADNEAHPERVVVRMR